MATRAKFGTKKALKGAKEASRTAVAGGANVASRVAAAASRAVRIKAASKLTPLKVSKAVVRDLKKYGSVTDETKMMKAALKTGIEPRYKKGILAGMTRKEATKYLKENPPFKWWKK